MPEQHLYQIALDPSSSLLVNNAPIDVPDVSADERLAWAFQQVAAVHASLSPDSVMRVEVLDDQRVGGYGVFATDLPFGRVLTLDMLRSGADRSRARRFGDNPSGVAYPVDHTPLYPIPKPFQAGERNAVAAEHTSRFGSDAKRLPYTPKEPLPDIKPRERAKPKKDKPTGSFKSWSTRRKAVVAAAGAVVLVGGGAAVTMQHPKNTYSRVCVNNMSYERLPDDSCDPAQSLNERWWYVQPHKNVPAVGDYVDSTAGTFTKPSGGNTSVTTGVDKNGVTEKGKHKH